MRHQAGASDNSAMVLRSAFSVAVLFLPAACGKSVSTEPQTKASNEASEVALLIDAAPAPPTADSAISNARTAPPGWKRYENVGYSVTAPPAPPKNTDFGDSAELQGLTLAGQEFRFADCFAQVMRLHYGGSEEFDIEKGLDGGIEKMLANIGVKKTESSREPNEGRIARQYQVEGTWKGTQIQGLGRGIAADDKTVIIVNAFWQATDTTCPELGEFFVNSLAVEVK